MGFSCRPTRPFSPPPLFVLRWGLLVTLCRAVHCPYKLLKLRVSLHADGALELRGALEDDFGVCKLGNTSTALALPERIGVGENVTPAPFFA